VAVEYDISTNRQASQAFRQFIPPAAHVGLGRQRLKFLLNRFNKSIRPGLAVIRDIIPNFGKVDSGAGA
jgi:hypothetical protein